MIDPVIEARDLTKLYEVKNFFRTVGQVRALDGVSFSLGQQETLAVVGESGCGKSTLAKLLMQIESPTSGNIVFDGKPAEDFSLSQRLHLIQMIFQDPYSSLNPRKRAWESIAEPLIISDKLKRREAKEKAEAIMEKTGLRPEYSSRYPHMFSGGQRQRIGIARALVMNPKLIVCDEPVSALDVSVQAQILNLLLEMQEQQKLSYIFISHDLSVVKHIADKVLVIYLGQVVETGRKEDIFSNPQHPYTQALLSCSPEIRTDKRKKPVIQGEIPSRLAAPVGCPFTSRCPSSKDICKKQRPILKTTNGEHKSACHFN